jgi:D-alanyl-D-alanine carboxypeptidase
MADPESPWGPLFGHGGGGPGYDASVFHAPGLARGGTTVCALCAVEEDFLAENLVAEAFDLLRGSEP